MFERLSRQLDSPLTLFNTTNTREQRATTAATTRASSRSPSSSAASAARRYAFVGLERDSGIVVFDVTTPAAPAFVTYVNNRKFRATRPARSWPAATRSIAAIWDRKG